MTVENRDEIKHRYVEFWSEIASKLPENIDPESKSFARGYFRAQLRLALGKKVKAGRIFESLDRKKGYQTFEEKNEPLLAAIDLAVRGETRRTNIEPLFRMNNNKR